MNINVGSKNKIKITAVKEAVKLYPKLFPNPKVTGFEVNIPLFGHPLNLQETVEGAIKRAKEAFVECDYSFGIEGGLMEIPHSKTGFIEVGVCAVFDGKNLCLGLGPGYEWPKEVTKLILNKKADASLAFNQLRLTHHKKLGAIKGGIVGFLTQGRITREDFTKYSIIMALIQLEKPQMY